LPFAAEAAVRAAVSTYKQNVGTALLARGGDDVFCVQYWPLPPEMSASEDLLAAAGVDVSSPVPGSAAASAAAHGGPLHQVATLTIRYIGKPLYEASNRTVVRGFQYAAALPSFLAREVGQGRVILGAFASHRSAVQCNAAQPRVAVPLLWSPSLQSQVLRGRRVLSQRDRCQATSALRQLRHRGRYLTRFAGSGSVFWCGHLRVSGHAPFNSLSRLRPTTVYAAGDESVEEIEAEMAADEIAKASAAAAAAGVETGAAAGSGATRRVRFPYLVRTLGRREGYSRVLNAATIGPGAKAAARLAGVAPQQPAAGAGAGAGAAAPGQVVGNVAARVLEGGKLQYIGGAEEALVRR
jgi:hypothetical protein